MGRAQIVDFLTKKWEKENGYRLRKELFAFTDNYIAVQVRASAIVIPAARLTEGRVQFWYEWFETKPDGTKQWYRTYGLEVWGLVNCMLASGC